MKTTRSRSSAGQRAHASIHQSAGGEGGGVKKELDHDSNAFMKVVVVEIVE
jgi:hypothetical protein